MRARARLFIYFCSELRARYTRWMFSLSRALSSSFPDRLQAAAGKEEKAKEIEDEKEDAEEEIRKELSSLVLIVVVVADVDVLG